LQYSFEGSVHFRLEQCQLAQDMQHEWHFNVMKSRGIFMEKEPTAAVLKLWPCSSNPLQ